MNALNGKIAIVTGGAGGIGGGQVERFVAEGAKVVIADVAEDLGTALAAKLGENAVFRHLDVRDEASWNDVVADTVSRWGGVDVLVNTAGIAGYRLIADLTVERYMNMIQINQIGVFLGIRSVIATMTERGGGSIINVSSYAGVRAGAGVAAYSSTKFAVRALTQSAAIELAPFGIRVNALLPGVIDTPPVQGWAQDRRAASIASIPLGKFGSMDQAARMAVFLASDESSYSTGADFYVDGGVAIASGREPPRAKRAKV
ncbi:MAG: glucose 1-dehydrogenase [Hyphomonadaceae bacterium]|nr:glucose 1-dehydrogenase [Hyphomonadaceae bacterium]